MKIYSKLDIELMPKNCLWGTRIREGSGDARRTGIYGNFWEKRDKETKDTRAERKIKERKTAYSISV